MAIIGLATVTGKVDQPSRFISVTCATATHHQQKVVKFTLATCLLTSYMMGFVYTFTHTVKFIYVIIPSNVPITFYAVWHSSYISPVTYI